ncbi:hypothetical protein VPH35_102025 [Triticum aestivum]
MGRRPCCDKVGLKRGKWTAEEDAMLAKYIAQHGEGSWRSLPKNAGLLRCGKSCRLRWLNYLRGGVRRGNFSKEEDDLIVRLHATLGNSKTMLNCVWSLIARQLSGRTDNEIKNYWNSHLSRQIHSFRRAYTTGKETTITIHINKWRGMRAPGKSPRNKTKKPPVPELTNVNDVSSLVGAISSTSRLPEGYLEQNDRINNMSVSRTSGERYSEEPILVDPEDRNGVVPRPNCMVDRIGLTEANNSMNGIGILKDDSKMEALLSSINMPASGLNGIEHESHSGVEDLMDTDWEGLSSHIWDNPTQDDLLETTEPRVRMSFESDKREPFVNCLFSEAC